MGIIETVKNYFNATVGRNQEFEKLLAAKDISGIIDQMNSKEAYVLDAIKEYEPLTHEIMKRGNKVVVDKQGKIIRHEKQWMLPIPYPSFINEISLVFLYGRPVKWVQQSEGTDEVFEAFTDLIKSTRFDSRIRQCKRIAGAETESAMLFRVFRNKENKPDVQIRVLAKSKGDDIRVRWDQYDNIISIGWGYYIKEDGKTVRHFDIFTANVIYRCKQVAMGGAVEEEENPIGKIPIILFHQDKEWKGVEPMIEREEYIASRTADTNDYFADPMVVMDSTVVKNMPEKKDANKLLITNGENGVDKAVRYLTWDSAPESKMKEIEWLQKQILSKTFTPDINFDNMKGLSNVSGKALKQMMILADVKAAKHKEVHDELLDRTASLLLSIIGNVLNIGLKAQTVNAIVGHQFQEPFGEDVTELIKNLVEVVDAGLLSQEGGIERNPLIDDVQKEIARLNKEKEIDLKKRNDLFRSEEDDIFPTKE